MRQSRTVPRLGRGSSLWIHYLFLLWRMARLLNAPLFMWTRQTANRRRKSIFRWASGNESAWLHSIAFLSASHSASHFLTLHCWFLLSDSLEFCSWYALALIPPLKTHHHISIPPLCISVRASSSCLSPETCARYSCVCVCVCDGRKHATEPCHDQQSSMPVNDTSRHPTAHITMVARLSAGWISGRTSHFGSAPDVGLQWRWHQRLWMTPLWQPLPPTLCHYYRFSQCMLQDREREMED